ncbi:MAG: hypothetical protein IJJ92_08520 [Clostridia bacterium]|nr:hypothetical protein [Clostridia bacterium]
MANEYVNKVIYGNTTLIDLTSDDVTVSDVLTGKRFHLPSGAAGTGTCNYDAYTSDATASAAEILAPKTAYKNGSKLTGTMTNRGSVTGTIATKTGQYTIAQGYHDGTGKVSIDSTEQAKIIAGNIKNGVEILGVTGTYTGSELIRATTKSATPYTTAKTYLPSGDGAYDYYTQVTVAAIAYSEVDNAAGGKTVTIGTVDPAA